MRGVAWEEGENELTRHMHNKHTRRMALRRVARSSATMSISPTERAAAEAAKDIAAAVGVTVEYSTVT